ncbi:MAG: GlsB/YeaQ/YmgE family stress response membrane protein [Xanthobacteraceae bacterium]
MGPVAWIIVGLIAGWLAARITSSPGGLLRNLAVGLVGAILGGLVFDTLNIQVVPGFLGGLVTATIGAIVFLVIWRAAVQT